MNFKIKEKTGANDEFLELLSDAIDKGDIRSFLNIITDKYGTINRIPFLGELEFNTLDEGEREDSSVFIITSKDGVINHFIAGSEEKLSNSIGIVCACVDGIEDVINNAVNVKDDIKKSVSNISNRKYNS